MLIRLSDPKPGAYSLSFGSISFHHKIYAEVKVYKFFAPYQNEAPEVKEKKWISRYESTRGTTSLLFRAPYINGYRSKERVVRFYAPYLTYIPVTKRYLFKDRYQVQSVSNIQSFYIFSAPYLYTVGKSSVEKTWSARYTNSIPGGVDRRYTWKIGYSHRNAVAKSYTFSDQYINYQVKNSGISIIFRAPYLNTISTYANTVFVDSVDFNGGKIKVGTKLQTRIEQTRGGKYALVVPIVSNSVMKDELGDTRDFEAFITMPPKYLNYKLAGIKADNPNLYSDLKSSPPEYKDSCIDGEKLVGQDITSILIENPRALDQYKDIIPESSNLSVIEFRVYNYAEIEDIASLSQEEIISRFPGISISIYSVNGDSKEVITDNGTLNVTSEVWGFDNKFANLKYRQRDTRDETIFNGFTERVYAYSQYFKVKIRETSDCCLDRDIDVNNSGGSICKLPKETINIHITNRDTEEILKLKPLDGFTRIEADPYSGNQLPNAGTVTVPPVVNIGNTSPADTPSDSPNSSDSGSSPGSSGSSGNTNAPGATTV